MSIANGGTLDSAVIEPTKSDAHSEPRERSIRVLFSEKRIALRIEELADEIGAAMPKELVVISVLKGGFIFTADLIRALHRAEFEPEIDFLKLSSYGEGTESSGDMKILFDLSANVAGREVLIVDDILDTGRTISFARDLLVERAAASVKTCCLLDKAERRLVDIQADFIGFPCPNEFVVGYGLDYAHRYRELPFIGVLSES